MGKVFIYGLTGMSGAGKSTVCKVFADKGLNIIDCDKVSREVTKKDSKCLKKLSEVFSKDIITQSGELNRRLLGGIVFSNKEKLQLLNDTIYPYITYNILKKLENEKGIVILDAPTLFESGIDFICDGVISVICNREASLNRITLRDNIDIKTAMDRLDSQHDEDYYKKRSLYCIENNESLDMLIKKAEAVADKLLDMVKK